MSIYELKTGKYQVSYKLPYSHKRRRHKYESMDQAIEAQKVVEATFRPDVSRSYATTTVRELMQLHIRRCPNTRISFQKGYIVPRLLAQFGDCQLKDLTKIDLERWLYDVREERDLSLRTLKTVIGNLNHFFDFLVEEGALVISPLRKIKMPADHQIPPRKARVSFSEKELSKILEQAKLFSPHYLYPLFLTYIHTGARRAEALDLQWQDVDFAHGMLTFRSTKNGSDRQIRIPEKVRALLQAMPRRATYVFVDKDGSRLKKYQLEWLVKVFQRTFPSEKKWGLHAFRHSFAHNFLKAGGQMYQLQAILGHRNIGITINLYGQLQAVEIENPSPYRF